MTNHWYYYQNQQHKHTLEQIIEQDTPSEQFDNMVEQQHDQNQYHYDRNSTHQDNGKSDQYRDYHN